MASERQEQTLAEAIRAGAGELGQALPGAAPADLARFLLLLARWSSAYNLTAVRVPESMVAEHVLDAFSIRPLLEGRRILDAGTGAGLPGLVLAVAEPERQFTLVDSSAKKLRFVRHAAGELDIRNVTIVRTRVEDFAPETGFDTVLSRAFAPLRGFIESAGHLITRGGQLLAQKGQVPGEELARLPPGWRAGVEPLEVPRLGKTRHAVRLRRTEIPE